MRVVAVRHRDLAHLDVPVAGELVPHHLHRAAHHVRLVGRLALGPPLGPPPPLGRHARQHAGLRGADGRGADGVGRLGRVPQVGQHVHAAPLDLGGLRVLVLVDHVLVDRQLHQARGPRAPPRSGRTWPGSGGRCRRASARPTPPGTRPSAASRPGEPVLGHRPGQVLPGEHGVLQLLTDGVTLVQRHSQHLLDQGRSAPGSRGIAPLSGRRRHCSPCWRHCPATSSPIAGECANTGAGQSAIRAGRIEPLR